MTTTRLVNTDGGTPPGQGTLAMESTTTSQGRTQSNTTVTAVVWPDYSPTPGLSKRFQGRKERGNEKRTSWTALGRTPKTDLGVPVQPRELCKRLNATVLTTVFP
ncbi:hypothetical protein Taro_002708 [Colocasia esculenta]|uniref:Uncharacterized protein n=1 Tax=Colocasia esculenta TaxID=4460 RepID=A0A843TH95_COLES|nr:hypothetical protein [Colocasia esculenta]